MRAQPIHAIVVSSVVPGAGEDNAGDELAIIYTVDIDMPEGAILRLESDSQQLPRRWPSTVKVQPHPTGKSVLGFIVNDTIVLDYRAYPLFETCGTTTTPPPATPS